MVLRFLEYSVYGLDDGECFCYRLDLVVVVESAAVWLLAAEIAASYNCPSIFYLPSCLVDISMYNATSGDISSVVPQKHSEFGDYRPFSKVARAKFGVRSGLVSCYIVDQVASD
jgi:hypothetical protein